MGNDLIERQAAIDALDGNVIVTSRESAQAVMDYIRGCADRIRSLPSAQPEPDTALYVEGFNDGYKQGKKDAQPDVARDIATIIENEKDMRVILAQPETAKRIVGKSRDGMTLWYQCDMCNEPVDAKDAFCSGCGRRLTDG